MARRTLADRGGLVELNRLRASRGLEAGIAVRQSDQQVAASRVEVSAAEAAVQLDRHQLAALLGLGPDAPLEVEQALHPYGEALALPARADAERALHRVRVQRPHWHARVEQRDLQHVLQQAAREEATAQHALQHRRLDRRALDVGVEANVAEEHAVGGRDRLATHGHRGRAAHAI